MGVVQYRYGVAISTRHHLDTGWYDEPIVWPDLSDTGYARGLATRTGGTAARRLITLAARCDIAALRVELLRARSQGDPAGPPVHVVAQLIAYLLAAADTGVPSEPGDPAEVDPTDTTPPPPPGLPPPPTLHDVVDLVAAPGAPQTPAYVERASYLIR